MHFYSERHNNATSKHTSQLHIDTHFALTVDQTFALPLLPSPRVPGAHNRKSTTPQPQCGHTCQISGGSNSTFRDSSAPALPITRCTGAGASTYTALLLTPLLLPLPLPLLPPLLPLLPLLPLAADGACGAHFPLMTGQVRW
jgi:hypothetical protein